MMIARNDLTRRTSARSSLLDDLEFVPLPRQEASPESVDRAFSRNVTSLVVEIDDVLRGFDMGLGSHRLRQCQGLSSQPNWRVKLQRAARRVQAARDSGFAQPTWRQFAAAREVLDTLGHRQGWRLGVLPDGEGGLELRFIDDSRIAQVSVTLSDDEFAATFIEGARARTEYFATAEELAAKVGTLL